jgi:hypothetical protein
MKKSLTLLMMLLLVSALSAVVKAQNNVSLTSGGFIMVSGESPGTPLSTQSAQGKPIAAQISFGDASPSVNFSRRIIVKMPIRISASTNYKIEFQRLLIGDNAVNPSDIGFGITNIRPQIIGSSELRKDALNLNGANNFFNDPCTSPIINGRPKFLTTLENIGEDPTLVLTGVPTVASEKSDDVGKDETAILADLVFVLAPQYFDASKSSNLKINMTITPQ